MPRGKNQEIYALGEFPLCKMDKRVSLWSRLDERSQRAWGLQPNGKEMWGEGQGEPEQNQGLDAEKDGCAWSRDGARHTLGPPGKNCQQGWWQELTSHQDGQCGSPLL